MAGTGRAFSAKHEVLLAGGWGVGMDILSWLCGMQNLMVLTQEQPRMVAELLEMVSVWNKQRIELILSANIDLYVRRAWYEGCDFITRDFFRSEVLPRLKAEVDLVHEAGIDALIGIDPVQGTHTDMSLLKQKLGGRICLWGGVSGAVTVEMGSEEEVRAAVREAIDDLGPCGFILSPVDNVTVDAPKTWHNLDFLLDEWRKNRTRR